MSELSQADIIIMLGREAKGILEVCDRIFEASRNFLGSTEVIEFGARRLESAQFRESDAYKALRCARAPIVARVGAKDGANRTRVFYICPCEPPPGCRRSLLVNVFTPFGRILATSPGDVFQTPEGERLAITDKTTMVIADYARQQDVFGAYFEYLGHYKTRLKSLRDIVARLSEPRYSLRSPVEDSSSPVGQTRLILEGDNDDEVEVEVAVEEESEIISTVPVSRLADQGLRLVESSLLDPAQDNICRQPLGARILLVGPAGVGKTMTMIRGLDFKITRDCLAGEEEAIVERLEAGGYLPHAISWQMFTPTRTIKRYVKSAFQNFFIPGYQDNIASWAEYRKKLARELFGVLHTPKGGKLILSSNLNYLTNQARTRVERWFEDFNHYHWQFFINKLKGDVARLAASSDHNLSALGVRSREAIERCQTGALARLYLSLEPRVPTISGYDASLSKAVLEATSQIIKTLGERDPNFLSDMTDFYESWPNKGAPQEPEPEPGSEVSYQAAYAFLSKVLREKSRAVALDQAYQVDEFRSQFWALLAGRVDEASLAPLGHNCLLLTSLRKLNCSSPSFVGDYFETLVESYLAYRETGPEWYVKPGINNLYINDLELDIILLAILEASSALLWQDYLKPGRLPLGPVLAAHKKELRNLILVDEASDFSPVALKCMINLTVPSSGSFFATADFNQRFTPWGAKSMADFEWAVPGLVEFPLTLNYRPSEPLGALAEAVAVKPGQRYAAKTEFASAATFRPVLLTNAETLEDTVAWIANRIREIILKVGQTPSIAVFLNSETELGNLAQALTGALAAERLKAVVFRESETPQKDSSLRVFNLKHIKGLEFEAVFLLDLDKLAQSIPDLYRQYLYAAITRAATFFGVTCQTGLPSALERLAPMFGADWA
ncbi:MAG: ATP-binding domain-containing protein [Deltaproteobacteria bacterium]|jgi:hypothetical protein|nr:ATP-binding domain-containing protein [Deltaproteobacteria bacterium]